MYKIFMLIMIPVIFLGWLGYWLWDKRMTKLEQEDRKNRGGTDHLRSVNDSFKDYAEKLTKYERKDYDHLSKDKQQ